MSEQDRLETLRARIDELDHSLVRLLTERARTAAEIGETKRELGIPVQDGAREQDGLARVVAANEGGPIGDETLRRIYEAIMAACLAVQRQAETEQG